MTFLKVKKNWLDAFRSHPNLIVALFYLLVLVVCFHQLVFGNATIKWDAFRLWFPWKHFIVNELLNGNLPLWNPYHLGGFPQQGDSMTWYPVSWVFGWITGGYNLTSLNLEYLFHLFIAGFGFFKFTRVLHPKWWLCALLGLSYMLSGFMLGNAQHMGWIVSAAWLPWIAIYLFRLVDEPGWKAAMHFSVVGFLFFSGGYLALFFITLYFIFGYLIYSFFKRRKRRSKILLYSFVSLALITLLAAPILYSFIDLSSLFDRASPTAMGADFNINYGGTPLNGILAIFFPFVSGVFHVSEIQFGTFSTFFGSIPVILILLQWRKLISRKKALMLFVLGVLLLLVSIGDPLPLRNLLSHLPFLDLFRYPTIFRLFSIFAFLSLVALLYRNFSFDLHSMPWLQKKKPVLIVGLGLMLLAVLLFFFYRAQNILSIEFLIHPVIHLSSLLEWQRLVFNLLVVLFLSGALLLVLIYYKHYAKRLIAIVWGLELVVIASLATYTVVNQAVNVSYANARLGQQPLDFQGLAEHHSANEQNEWKNYLGFAWQGKSILLKQPSQNGFSPMKLKSSESMKSAAIQLPEASDFLTRVSMSDNGATEIRPTNALFYPVGSREWKIVVHDPLSQDEYFVLKQRKTPNWKVETDESSGFELMTTQAGFMVMKPNGDQAIHLKYKDKFYEVSFVLFTLTLLLIVAALLFSSRNRKMKDGVATVFLVVLLFGCYQNWNRWFPAVLPKIPANKITSGTNYEMLASSVNSAERAPIYVAQNTPKEDRFLDELNYFLEKEGQYSIGSPFSKYVPSKDSSYEVLRIPGKDFRENGYSIDLTQLVTEKLTNEAIFLRVDFSKLQNKTLKLWLKHSQDGERINGEAWKINESIPSDHANIFIRSIDLAKYDLQRGSTLSLFLWPLENSREIDIHQLIIERYR